MVQITERASAELRRLLTDYFARPQQGVRLRLNEAGGLAMTIDTPHSGDSVIRRDNLPLLIVDGRLATRLAQRVLDFPSRFAAEVHPDERSLSMMLNSGDNRRHTYV